ncbi:phytanoyl-CoA dioxygenase family protein [Actinopolymorpha singaporensis]|uniref:Phytanoyl-CoA dioxygenase (PhyH) n=1 Tax=Actinopolymorpha singaporensis TaxID=117157 RepID=A0A1H1QEJ0_9ACTN|nr:phytanoyl-CoA dioxygenase family protein [Actinopolymorpha singaporensis]SDS21717.1 Phytanoyl-CoA dioxygenase (PhyH) [Actinopolymorpha singaporensis]
MNDQDRYLFDLQGYLTIPDAIPADLLQRLNAQLDEMAERETEPDMRTHRFGDLLGRDAAFRTLMDLPPVVDVLDDVLGSDFRLDHTYADIIRSGDGPIGTVLHGGAVPFRASEYYTVTPDGRIRSGLVAVGFNLKDVGPDDGGFACVPGSHKSAFPFPDAWKQLANQHPCVRRVTGPAGTAVVFTEALVHGTLPWRGADERRTAFYKYSPAAVSWSAGYYDADDYPDLTERQRAMLEAPNARYGGRLRARA